MKLVTPRVRDVEQKLMAEVSGSRLIEYTRGIARWVRLSGTPEERESFLYVKGLLDGFGLKTTLHEHPAYVSLPGPASLLVLHPEIQTVECITHSFAASTPPEGVEGEVVYVGAGMPADYVGRDVRGKIVLTDGLAMPPKVKAAEDAGAKASIHVNDDNFHEMICSTIWGSPTLEQARQLPHTPVVSVKRPDGERVKSWLKERALRVRIRAQVDTRWRTTPLLVAEITGTEDPDHFVLFSGHLDSWHLGAMDNGTANATMIEVGRILAANRQHLRQGLRLAFWSGHSHGRYSGSAWYVDSHWEELYHRCVVHVNVDSVGAKGATVLTEAMCMVEARALAADVIHAVAGQEYEGSRPSRAGDQSFWGLGISSMFMDLSEQAAPETAEPTAASLAVLLGKKPKSGGLGWWWHTIHDTMDRIDEANLVRDCTVYVGVVFRLCASPVLPMDYTALAKEYVDTLSGFQERAKGKFDLGEAVARARRLQERVAALQEKATALAAQAESGKDGDDRRKAAVLNNCFKRLGRILIPTDYSGVGPFGHDPAMSIPPFPALQVVSAMGAMDPSGDDFKFAQVAANRGRNQVLHTLRLALDEVEAALQAC